MGQPARQSCPSCKGKGGYGPFGYCERKDIHYKNQCNTCNGAGQVDGFPTRCDSCQGKGASGTFGPCTPWDIHKKSVCNFCNGRGFRFF